MAYRPRRRFGRFYIVLTLSGMYSTHLVMCAQLNTVQVQIKTDDFTAWVTICSSRLSWLMLLLSWERDHSL